MDDGVRLRKNAVENGKSGMTEEAENNEEAKTDLVSRLIESTKELTDCMPTDLPSAKRMVIASFLVLLFCLNVGLLFTFVPFPV